MTTSPQFAPDRSGVYRLPSDASQLREAARREAAAWFDVDLSKARDKSDLLRAFAAALSFPKTFGENWDALTDSLEDLSWQPAPAYVLAVSGTGSMRDRLGGDFPTLLEILAETASFWRDQGHTFIVFVEDNELRQWT